MSLSATITAMVSAGCTPEQLAAVVCAHEASEAKRLADKRAKDAERQRRSRLSRGVTVTERDKRDELPPKKETSPTPPKEKTTPLSSEPTALRCLSGRERFDELWEAYPRRSGSNSRKNAEQRFSSAIKAGVSAETMIDGAKRYPAHRASTGIVGTGFVKMTEAWINGQLWTSDYTPNHGPPPRQAKRNTALDGLDELERRFSANVQQPHLRIAG